MTSVRPTYQESGSFKIPWTSPPPTSPYHISKCIVLITARWAQKIEGKLYLKYGRLPEHKFYNGDSRANSQFGLLFSIHSSHLDKTGLEGSETREGCQPPLAGTAQVGAHNERTLLWLLLRLKNSLRSTGQVTNLSEEIGSLFKSSSFPSRCLSPKTDNYVKEGPGLLLHSAF